MANPENKQLPYESTQKDIRDGIDGASAKLTTTELTPRNLADVLAEEIKALTTVVGGLNFINCVVVAQLPTTGISTTTIYLVPKSPSQQDNIYDEYINLDGTVNGWEKIGDTEIDLSNYYTKTETDTLLSDKVDKVNGKGLSTNDYTDAEKTKLAGIEANAEVNVQSDWSQADSSADDYIKNKPSNLVSDASYVHTDNNFTNAEKTKLGGIESGAEVNVQSDWNEADNTADDYIKNKPSSEVKSATDTFTTVNGGLLEECNIELTPIQDLHGYDSPWVGGSRKNKLPLVLADIKSVNVGGTWSGNVYTWYNSTFEILQDSDGNVTGVKVGGTNSGTACQLYIPVGNLDGDYYFCGCANGGAENTYNVLMWDRTTSARVKKWDGTTNSDTATDLTTPHECKMVSGHNIEYRIRVMANASVNNVICLPMIVSKTETDFTFEPYSNICPISGHTEVDLYNVGKNRLPLPTAETKNGITLTHNADGSITLTGTATSTTYFDFFVGDFDSTAYAGYLFRADSEYTSWGINGISFRISSESRADLQTLLGNSDYEINNNGSGLYFAIRVINRFAIPSGGITIYPMLRKSTDSADFEPYLGHLYQVQIGSTVYGGTVDLVSGVMTAIWAGVDMGTLSYDYNSTNVWFRTTELSALIAPSLDSEVADIYSEQYKKVSRNTMASDLTADATIAVNNNEYVLIRDTRYGTDYNAFKTAMSGVLFVYKLATPQTIQLSPTMVKALVGENHLSTPLDGQSIDSVKYREVFAFDDVEKVVSLRVPISMLGTDESGRTTASQSYASGDYFYKDGYMCKALTSISAGATLTLNTNYSQGTLADILKAIENA